MFHDSGKDLRVHASKTGRHTIPDEEKRSIVEHINLVVGDDPLLEGLVPIDPLSDAIYSALNNGLLLLKLIEKTAPGTIDFSKINNSHNNKGKKFTNINNINYALDALRTMGCKIINVGAEDIMRGEKILIMGILWQIVQKGLSLQMHTVMEKLFRNDQENNWREKTEKEILLIWANKHLLNAGYSRPGGLTNFSSDVCDAKAYALVLEQLAPKSCPRSNAMEAHSDLERAQIVMASAKKLGCDKFVKPEDIVSGNSNLNFAFIANLFKESVNFPDEGPPPGNDVSHVRVKHEVDERDVKIAELEEAVDALGKQLEVTNEKSANQMEELLRRIKMLEDENARLQSELEAGRGSRKKEQKANAEVKELKKELDAVQKRLRDRDSEVEGSKQELEEVGKQKEEMERRQKEAETERKRLKEEANDEANKLRKQITGLEADNDRLTATVEELDEEITNLKSNEWVRKMAETEKVDSYLKITYETIKKEVIMEGFFMKQANRNKKKWKKRYFVLTSLYLFYFINLKSKKGAKFLRMKKANVEKTVEGKRKYVIVINPKQGKHPYRIEFPNEDVTTQWYDKLRAVALRDGSGNDKGVRYSRYAQKEDGAETFRPNSRQLPAIVEEERPSSARRASPKSSPSSAKDNKGKSKEKEKEKETPVQSSGERSTKKGNIKKNDKEKEKKREREKEEKERREREAIEKKEREEEETAARKKEASDKQVATQPTESSSTEETESTSDETETSSDTESTEDDESSSSSNSD